MEICQQMAPKLSPAGGAGLYLGFWGELFWRSIFGCIFAARCLPFGTLLPYFGTLFAALCLPFGTLLPYFGTLVARFGYMLFVGSLLVPMAHFCSLHRCIFSILGSRNINFDTWLYRYISLADVSI